MNSMQKIILFGCGTIGIDALGFFGKERVYAFCDNNKKLSGTKKNGIKIISFDELVDIYNDFIIIICANFEKSYSIAKQLHANGINEYLIYEMIRGNKLYADIYDSSELLELYINDKTYIYDMVNLFKDSADNIEYKLDYLIEHTDVKTLLPAKGYFRKRQLDLINFSVNFINSVYELGITPFLIGGNLLGYVRHNGFIPWDDDVDFGLIRNEYDKLYEYCSEKFYTAVYDGEDQMAWVDEITRSHPDEYVNFVFPEHFTIAKGTTMIDRLSVDFFSFDYCNEEYSFDEYKEYIDKIYKKKDSFDSEKEKLLFLKNEIKENKFIVNESKQLYFGLDDIMSYTKQNDQYISKETIFPLHRVFFEGVAIFIPNKPEDYIKFECSNYMNIPKDFGMATHNYLNDYKRECLASVDFYITSKYEIEIFREIYDYLRNRGVYAVYVIEKSCINITGIDVDYSGIMNELNIYMLEYRTECNFSSGIVFTTGNSKLLRKYENTKKIKVVSKNSKYGINESKEFDYIYTDIEKESLKSIFNIAVSNRK